MTEQLRQSLSAVIDGEADAFELRRVLDELERNPELRAAWERYHLIGSVMRGERTVRSRSATQALANRVPRAVREATEGTGQGTADRDPTAARGAADAFLSGRRAWVGVGLAAGLALAVLVGVLPDGVDGPAAVPVAGGDPGDSRTARFAQVTSDSGSAGPAAGDPVGREPFAIERRVRDVNAADLRRAQAYMLQHAQQQGLEHRGVISLVKMATYEAP